MGGVEVPKVHVTISTSCYCPQCKSEKFWNQGSLCSPPSSPPSFSSPTPLPPRPPPWLLFLLLPLLWLLLSNLGLSHAQRCPWTRELGDTFQQGKMVSTWEVLCIFLVCLDKNLLLYYSIILIAVVELLSLLSLSDSLRPRGLQLATVFHYLPELAQTHVHWVSDAIQPSHPLSPPSPPAFNLSQHQGLCQWVSSSHQGPKYWSYSFSISSANKYLRSISFRIDWFDYFNN